MLQHIVERRNNLINTLEKSYYTPQEILKKSKEVYQELGESPEFQSLEDEGIITDFDIDNSKTDQEEGKDVGLEKGGVGSGPHKVGDTITVSSPMASHSSINNKNFKVEKVSHHDFSSGRKQYVHIKDENGEEYELREDFVKKKEKIQKSIDQLHNDLIKATTFEQRKEIQAELTDCIEKAVTREIEGRELLFKSSEDNEFDEIVKGFEDLEKSEGEDLEKGLGNKIHKYISKIRNRYIYENKNIVSSLNDLREYHKQKTGLDSIKRSLSSSPASVNTVGVNTEYKNKANEFDKKYGHKHDSDEATEKKRLTVNGMLSHIDNRLHEHQMSRLEKSDEEGLIKELIVRNELIKGEGDRGGNIIGHTKSGKPIYESGLNDRDYNKQDHLDASDLHADLGNKKSSLTHTQSDEASAHHFREHEKLNKENEPDHLLNNQKTLKVIEKQIKDHESGTDKLSDNDYSIAKHQLVTTKKIIEKLSKNK
jgi:hypothetical protein